MTKLKDDLHQSELRLEDVYFEVNKNEKQIISKSQGLDRKFILLSMHFQ
jgi:hypothetical protein